MARLTDSDVIKSCKNGVVCVHVDDKDACNFMDEYDVVFVCDAIVYKKCSVKDSTFQGGI